MISYASEYVSVGREYIPAWIFGGGWPPSSEEQERRLGNLYSPRLWRSDEGVLLGGQLEILHPDGLRAVEVNPRIQEEAEAVQQGDRVYVVFRLFSEGHLVLLELGDSARWRIRNAADISRKAFPFTERVMYHLPYVSGSMSVVKWRLPSWAEAWAPSEGQEWMELLQIGDLRQPCLWMEESGDVFLGGVLEVHHSRRQGFGLYSVKVDPKVEVDGVRPGAWVYAVFHIHPFHGFTLVDLGEEAHRRYLAAYDRAKAAQDEEDQEDEDF